MHLTEDQETAIYNEICGPNSGANPSRLAEVTERVRNLGKGGFWAYRDGTPDHVYWVFGDKSGRIKMLRDGDPMRDWFAFTTGYAPVDMDRAVIDGIPVVGESSASKAAAPAQP